MSNIKEFKDQNGNVLAHAAIPDGYVTGGSLNDGFQHESVPFFITAHAVNNDKKIMIFGLSDEKFTTYRNDMIKMTLKAMADVKWNSIRDFIEPEDYLYQFASAMSQLQLTLVGEADLPSICGQNPEQAYKEFIAPYEAAIQRDAQLGTDTKLNNTICRSFMRRYSAKTKNGDDCTVVAGMDYQGVEYYSSVPGMEFMGGMMGSLFASKKKDPNSSKKFGHGTPCDAIEWGAKNKFLMMSPKEYEQEAFEAFFEFVSTFHMDDALRQRYSDLSAQRVQMRLQETMQFQGIAQANMQSLMFNQQRLTQTLAQNSASMSAGIMDSWNKKMASDSRISQARSEANLGVNTYQNSYGQNVQVSVAADHVYQNQYGDVYGVSGNAPDQDILNKLQWTELEKK